MRPHYFEEVAGWFDFPDVYRKAVGHAPDGGTLVEVGCWKGKSLSFLLVEAANSGKDLRIVGVDHFRGSDNLPPLMIEAAYTDIEKQCRDNCLRSGYPFELLRYPSVDAATLFEDESCDFVFIDASHDFASVEADIAAWRRKVKAGGVLAGHDFDESGPALAVSMAIPTPKRIGRCWWYEMPDLDRPELRGLTNTHAPTWAIKGVEAS